VLNQLEQGAQAFRHSGIQAFRRSGVQVADRLIA
jgi:hypothetical protein